jgi:hypothetical protein
VDELCGKKKEFNVRTWTLYRRFLGLVKDDDLNVPDIISAVAEIIQRRPNLKTNRRFAPLWVKLLMSKDISPGTGQSLLVDLEHRLAIFTILNTGAH